MDDTYGSKIYGDVKNVKLTYGMNRVDYRAGYLPSF